MHAKPLLVNEPCAIGELLATCLTYVDFRSLRATSRTTALRSTHTGLPEHSEICKTRAFAASCTDKMFTRRGLEDLDPVARSDFRATCKHNITSHLHTTMTRKRCEPPSSAEQYNCDSAGRDYANFVCFRLLVSCQPPRLPLVTCCRRQPTTLATCGAHVARFSPPEAAEKADIEIFLKACERQRAGWACASEALPI